MKYTPASSAPEIELFVMLDFVLVHDSDMGTVQGVQVPGKVSKACLQVMGLHPQGGIVCSCARLYMSTCVCV